MMDFCDSSSSRGGSRFTGPLNPLSTPSDVVKDLLGERSRASNTGLFNPPARGEPPRGLEELMVERSEMVELFGAGKEARALSLGLTI